MIIRHPRADEVYLLKLASAVAFERPFDYIKEKEASAAAEDCRDCHIRWAAFEDDDSTLLGSIGVSPYTVRFGGRTTGMGGIGGVSTLPAERRRGAIRECFRRAFVDMRENGMALSSLYPFSAAYYRQFGYESGARVKRMTVKLTALDRKFFPEPKGDIEMLLPDSDLSVLTEVYNRAYSGYDQSVVREEFGGGGEKKLIADCRYAYVWRDGEGTPRGFMIFSRDGDTMNCITTYDSVNSFVFENADALRGLLAFAGTFSSHYAAIRFDVPDDIEPMAIIGESNSVDCKLIHNGMVRAVDAVKLLEMCVPRGEGMIKIALTDPFAPWNEGIWQAECADGRVTVKSSDGPADIECGPRSFTALVCGLVGAADIPYLSDARLLSPGSRQLPSGASLDILFYKKRAYLLDRF